MAPGQTGMRHPAEPSRARNSIRSKNFLMLLLICGILCFTCGLFTSLPPDLNTRRTNTGSLTSTPQKLPGVWISSSAGRLGNQLGMYASLLSLARLNGRQAYLCPSSAKYLEPLFNLSLPRLPENENVNLTEYWLEYWMEEKYKNISLMRVHLTGHGFSWTLFDRYRDDIKREFTFLPIIRETTDTFLRSVAAKIHSQFSGANITFVGMHVRRGDNVYVVPKQWKGVIADARYLAKAMERMRGRYPDSVFVVASDDVTWCRHNINVSRGDVYFVADGIPQASPGQDIAVLAACNHTIMTIGTFGFWCAYLAGGDVIYLSNYILPNSPFLKIFRYKAAFLPTWEGIPADLSPLTKKPHGITDLFNRH